MRDSTGLAIDVFVGAKSRVSLFVFGEDIVVVRG
jgi:hypothetical protein